MVGSAALWGRLRGIESRSPLKCRSLQGVNPRATGPCRWLALSTSRAGWDRAHWMQRRDRAGGFRHSPLVILATSHRVQIFPGRPFSMSDVTRILSAIEQGNPSAAAELLPLV